MKCALCNTTAEEDSKLCTDHHNMRMAAASIDRIMSGRGLNMENAEAFSEDNYIKMCLEDEHASS